MLKPQLPECAVTPEHPEGDAETIDSDDSTGIVTMPVETFKNDEAHKASIKTRGALVEECWLRAGGKLKQLYP